MFNKKALLIALLLASPRILWAGEASGGNYTITKDLIGASGSTRLSGGIYSLAYSFGEQTAAPAIANGNTIVAPGYYGGAFGSGLTFQMVQSKVGTTSLMQDGIQVGVPLQASITIDFSDQLLGPTLPTGIQATILTDHAGQSQNTSVPFTWTYNPSGQTLVIQPQGGWTGNTLYDVTLTPALVSINGFNLDRVYHIRFLTALDPAVDNVVLHNTMGTGSSAGSVVTSADLNIYVPQGAFNDYAVILFSEDPEKSPLRVDPAVVAEANAKAAESDRYRTAMTYKEVAAFDLNGAPLPALSKPIDISIGYTPSTTSPAPATARPQILSLYVLDEAHRLWVKMPRGAASASNFSGPVNRMAVFAIMGAPSNSTADVYPFPVPWRPHGPLAGDNPGQTGSVAGGITFTNLPAECTIKIYTISGDLVKELRHSDAVGPIAQEKWDGLTTNGDRTASGVYLWRVESPSDAKNGKLMIIL